MTSEAWIQHMQEMHEDKIRQFGLANVGVFPNEEDSTPSFTYTVGLPDHGFPDLILVGVNPTNGSTILNHVFGTYLLHGLRPERGDLIEGVANFPMRLGSVSRHNMEEEYMLFSCHRQERLGRELVPSLQLVITDGEGRFPLDPEYDHAYMDERLPCLAEHGLWDYLPETRKIQATDKTLTEVQAYLRKRMN